MSLSEEQTRILHRLVEDYKGHAITSETLAFQTNTTQHHILDVTEKLKTKGYVVYDSEGYAPTEKALQLIHGAPREGDAP